MGREVFKSNSTCFPVFENNYWLLLSSPSHVGVNFSCSLGHLSSLLDLFLQHIYRCQRNAKWDIDIWGRYYWRGILMLRMFDGILLLLQLFPTYVYLLSVGSKVTSHYALYKTENVHTTRKFLRTHRYPHHLNTAKGNNEGSESFSVRQLTEWGRSVQFIFRRVRMLQSEN